MSKRNWKLFIEDILESMELIENYISGMDFQNFINDRKTLDAVIRNLEIIGEAARNIPEEIRYQYQDIDWEGIIGLRNRIAHEYFGINSTIIWEIVSRELLVLKNQIKRIYEQ